MSVPSAAEVEHADWPTLQGMCRSLGLNPKGRSGVVRMRVLEHVRRRGRPESWRAGRDHMAALLTRLGFPDLAEDLWESAIRLDAPAPWVGLGQAQVAGGFLSEAAKSFDRAIQMGDTSALLNRAEALGAGGDYDQAIAACESYLASHPTDLRALAMKADFLARSGFKEEGARVLLAAADFHPEFPFLHAGAGTAFLRAGRPEVALEAFGPTPPMEGSAIEGALNHGAALLLLGRTREAIDIFQKALENAPERGEALNNLGVAYLQMDEPKLAASNLARATKHVDSPRIRINLAAYLKRGGRVWPFRRRSSVLYLGAGSGTTASHVSDVCAEGTVTAIEISPRSFRDLLVLSEKRPNLVPILGDASKPESYGGRVGSVDVLYQDVAQRDQDGIFLRNLDLVRSGGIGFLMVKARSADVSASPPAVFDSTKRTLSEAGIEVIDFRILEPFQADHGAVVVQKP